MAETTPSIVHLDDGSIVLSSPTEDELAAGFEMMLRHSTGIGSFAGCAVLLAYCAFYRRRESHIQGSGDISYVCAVRDAGPVYRIFPMSLADLCDRLTATSLTLPEPYRTHATRAVNNLASDLVP